MNVTRCDELSVDPRCRRFGKIQGLEAYYDKVVCVREVGECVLTRNLPCLRAKFVFSDKPLQVSGNVGIT